MTAHAVLGLVGMATLVYAVVVIAWAALSGRRSPVPLSMAQSHPHLPAMTLLIFSPCILAAVATLGLLLYGVLR